MKCDICNKREVGMYRNINDHPFIIPFSHTTEEDGKTIFKHKIVRNICDHCYKKVEKTMTKLMVL